MAATQIPAAVPSPTQIPSIPNQPSQSQQRNFGELEVVASLTQVQTRGKVPISRFIHAAVEIGGKLYLFGGRDKEGQSLNDSYVYDPVSSNCAELEVLPKFLAGHTAVVHDQKVYVFGGFDGTNYNDNMLSYDPKSNSWETLTISGRSPPGRYCHSAVYNEGVMYIVGGDNHKDRLNDLWSFDFASNKWNEIRQRGKTPEPRQGLIAALYNENLYTFGGFDKSKHSAIDTVWKFDIKSSEWSQIDCKGTVPNARHGHAGVVFGDSWIIHGGRKDHGEKYNIDVYEFQFDTQEWRRLGVVQHAASPWGCPAVRFGHQANLDPYTNSVLLSGGYTHTDGVTFCPTNTILRLDLLPTLHSMNALNEKIAPLEDKMNQVVDEARELKGSVVDLENKVNQLSEDATTLRDKEAELEDKVDKITTNVIPGIEEKVKVLDEQGKELESKETALEEKEKELEEKLQRLEDDVSQLQELAGITKDHDDLKNDLKDIKERSLGLEGTVAEMAKENRKLAEENQQKIDDLNEKLRVLEEKELELEGKAQNSEEQEKILGDKITVVEDQLKDILNNNDLMKDALDNLAPLKDAIDQLRQENEDLRENIGKLVDLSELYKRVETLRVTIEQNIKETEKMRNIGQQLSAYGSDLTPPEFDEIKQ